VISALDSRGVYTDQNDAVDSNILQSFTDGTGGTFFHNNNDLNEGMRRVTSPPEFVYELAFYPKDAQEDGKYHHLKVRIVGNDKLTAAAREGYFASARAADPKQAETSEMNAALFSQNEIHNLPIQMQTQLYRDDKPPAKLNVVTMVDLGALPHNQANGQNGNELSMVAAIFDRNGKYIGAINRKVAVHWSDEKTGTQTAATFSFLLDPGAYLVRLVVCDSESHQLSAQGELVQIP
jgi:hypothetical protein